MLKQIFPKSQRHFSGLFLIVIIGLTGFLFSGCSFSLDTDTQVITSSDPAPSLLGVYKLGPQNEEVQIFISIASEDDNYFGDVLVYNKERTTLFPGRLFVNPLGNKWFAVSGDAISPFPNKGQSHFVIRIGDDIETVLVIQKLPEEIFRTLADRRDIKVKKGSYGGFSVVGKATKESLLGYLRDILRQAEPEQNLAVQKITSIPPQVINDGFKEFSDPLIVNDESELRKLEALPMFVPYLKSLDQRAIPWGAYLLSRLYLHGWGVEIDYVLAEKYANRSIQLGLEYGKATLGDLALSGYRKPGGIQFALKMFHEAAESGQPAAAAFLGDIYEKGDGVEKNQAEALKWYLLAADKGDVSAQFDLGRLYSVQKNYTEAVKWYGKAAEKGNAAAQVNLGNMYANGEGVPQDYRQAVKWYRKAAEQGQALAQFNLGASYLKGEGVMKDNLEAAKWFQLAAMQGHASAQFAMAVLYKNLDPVMAYAWRIVAANNNHKEARNSLQKYKARLGLSQIETAQRIVDEIMEKMKKAP